MRDYRPPQDVSELRGAMRRFAAVRRNRVPAEHDPLAVLRRHGCEAFFFGGTVRDVAVNGPWVRPRDIDVVVSGVEVERLQSVLAQWIVRTTRFGGFRLATPYEILDVWPIHRTWAFCEFPLLGSSASDLPRTTPFTVEAAVVSTHPRGPCGREVFEQRFLESVGSREIDLNFETQYSEALTVVRAIVMAIKTDFAVAPRLVDWLAGASQRVDIEELSAVAEGHYGRWTLRADELSYIVKAVQHHHRWAKRSRLRMPRPTQLRFRFMKPAPCERDVA
jgi:hypothetical protein